MMAPSNFLILLAFVGLLSSCAKPSEDSSPGVSAVTGESPKTGEAPSAPAAAGNASESATPGDSAACDPKTAVVLKAFNEAVRTYELTSNKTTLGDAVSACAKLKEALGPSSCKIATETQTSAAVSYESKKKDCDSLKSALDRLLAEEAARPPAPKTPTAPHPIDKKSDVKKLNLRIVSAALMKRAMFSSETRPTRLLLDGQPLSRSLVLKAVSEGRVGCWFDYNSVTIEDGGVLTHVLRTKSSLLDENGHHMLGHAFRTGEGNFLSLKCIAKGKHPSPGQLRQAVDGVVEILTFE